MKNIKTITLLIFSLISVCFVYSQKRQVNTNIVTNLTTSKKVGQGNVTINQSDKMNILLKNKMMKNSKDMHIFYDGYRVQVYMGNSQKVSKEEVKKRESKLKEKYKDLACYTTFSAPFWKLKVGDFRTYTDAFVFAQNIKSDFPSYSADVVVIKDAETRDLEMEKDE